MGVSSHEENLLQSLRIRQLSTVASLVVLLYEYVIKSKGEFRYIWRRPFKLNQAIYLFSRYFAIVIQSVNTYLALGPHSSLSIKESTCKKWQLFQVLAAYALTGVLHLVLMLMVYALHLRDLRIGIFLVLLYLSQLAVQGFVTPRAVLHIAYNPICNTTQVHPDILYLGISMGVTYISLGLMTAIKRDIVLLGAPVMKRVIRDGGWIIITLCSIFTTMLSYSWARQEVQGHIVYGWSNTILSIACCRIILNMETLNYAEPEHDQVVGFNSFDNLQLVRLERERRQRDGLEMDSVHNT